MLPWRSFREAVGMKLLANFPCAFSFLVSGRAVAVLGGDVAPR